MNQNHVYNRTESINNKFKIGAVKFKKEIFILVTTFKFTQLQQINYRWTSQKWNY